jgi:hypothetical protein
MNDYISLSKNEVILSSEIDIIDFIGYKIGKTIYVYLMSSGSLEIGPSGRVRLFFIQNDYAPKISSSSAFFGNPSSGGQVFRPCNCFIGKDKYVDGIFYDYSTTYGNDDYAWCTTIGIHLSWTIK